jgi:DNA-binding NarL/FixJ family response regulator
MIRVAVADDHAVVRRGLRQIIAESDDLMFAGEAASADDLLTLLRSRSFELLVLDYSLGSRSGTDVLDHVRSEFPHLPVLILSMHDEDLFAVRALRAGASGYVQKEAAAEELLAAIRHIAAGGTYLSPAMAQRTVADLARGSAPELLHERLSDRELEVFRLLGQGRSVTDIARTLNLSVKTVSTHRTRILHKTGLSDNSDIVRYVHSHGLA